MPEFIIKVFDDANWVDDEGNYWYTKYQIGYFIVEDPNLWLKYRKGVRRFEKEHSALCKLGCKFVEDRREEWTVED